VATFGRVLSVPRQSDEAFRPVLLVLLRSALLRTAVYNCVPVGRSAFSCSDDRKVVNSVILVTNVTYREKLYIAQLGHL
jgi:hypothetical protein